MSASFWKEGLSGQEWGVLVKGFSGARVGLASLVFSALPLLFW